MLGGYTLVKERCVNCWTLPTVMRPGSAARGGLRASRRRTEVSATPVMGPLVSGERMTSRKGAR